MRLTQAITSRFCARRSATSGSSDGTSTTSQRRTLRVVASQCTRMPPEPTTTGADPQATSCTSSRGRARAVGIVAASCTALRSRSAKPIGTSALESRSASTATRMRRARAAGRTGLARRVRARGETGRRVGMANRTRQPATRAQKSVQPRTISNDFDGHPYDGARAHRRCDARFASAKRSAAVTRGQRASDTPLRMSSSRRSRITGLISWFQSPCCAS